MSGPQRSLGVLWVSVSSAACCLWAPAVLAQPLAPAPAASATPAPAPPTAPASATTDGPTDAQKQEAKKHFDKGLALFDESAWDAALAEFLQSRTLFPTRAATKDAAVCLRKLHRFDEAVDEFESLLRDFQNTPADERAFAE